MSKTLAVCAADLLREHAPSTWTACAAADHVAPPPVPRASYDGYDSLLHEHEAADVIDLHRWGR